MPIKLNGTTIIDESTLANTDLNNLTSAGQNTISSIASSAITSGNFMKKINTTTCTSRTVNSSNSTTAPFDGWMILCTAYVSRSYNNQIYIKDTNTGTVSMPVKSGTIIYNDGANAINVLFFPEVS